MSDEWGNNYWGWRGLMTRIRSWFVLVFTDRQQIHGSFIVMRRNTGNLMVRYPRLQDDLGRHAEKLWRWPMRRTLLAGTLRVVVKRPSSGGTENPFDMIHTIAWVAESRKACRRCFSTNKTELDLYEQVKNLEEQCSTS